MKKSILLILLIVVTISLQAQDGKLKMQKTFGGVQFIMDGERLKVREVMELMKSNPEAHQAFKKAKSNYDAANVMGFAGGFLIGWPLGTAMGGGDPQWGLAGGGVALLLVAIPLNNGFKRHAKNAISLYNHDEGPVSRHKPSLFLTPYGTGAKLTLKF